MSSTWPLHIVRRVDPRYVCICTIAYSSMYSSTLCSEKNTHSHFFHISMNYVWIKTKIAGNIPKER